MEPKIVRLENNEIDLRRLIQYLEQANDTFNVPLDSRVNLVSYAEKLLSHGTVLVILVENDISAIIGYYSNVEEKTIYTSVYSAKKEIQLKGLSKRLIYEMCLDGKSKGLERVRFEVTDKRVMILHRRMGGIIEKEENKGGIWIATMSCEIDTYILNYLRMAKSVH